MAKEFCNKASESLEEAPKAGVAMDIYGPSFDEPRCIGGFLF